MLLNLKNNFDQMKKEDKKNENSSEPVEDTRTQTAIDLGVTIQEWNAMTPTDKIQFKN